MLASKRERRGQLLALKGQVGTAKHAKDGYGLLAVGYGEWLIEWEWMYVPSPQPLSRDAGEGLHVVVLAECGVITGAPPRPHFRGRGG